MLNILIVEDNAAHRESLRDLLTRKFPAMQVTEAADGDQALNEVLARRFDLVFMDVRLPHGNGIKLCKVIKTVWAGSMVCILTSYDIDEYREAAHLNGADHFLVKGDTSEDEISGLVESLLHMHFISLIIDSDSASRKEIDTLLAIHWPEMIVEATDNASDGLAHVLSLKPDLVLLELALPGVDVTDLGQLIHNISGKSVLVGMASEEQGCLRETVTDPNMDYCLPLAPSRHSKLVNLVKAIQLQH